jgi:hypothetical protein
MNIYSTSNVPAGYYVYAYIRIDGTPYYIGKGTKKRAWAKCSNDNIRPPRDINRIVICECNFTEIGALAVERRLIRWWGRKDIKTGILRNMTDGGDGSQGAVLSESHKKSIQKSLTGRNPTWCYRSVQGPDGVVYRTIKDASISEGITTEGIRYRCSVNKDGWKYLHPPN